MQALSAEHAEVKGSLRAEAVAKEVATRKLDRMTSNLGDTVTVRHHCTLCVCLSVSLSASASGSVSAVSSRFCLQVVSLVSVQGLLVINMSGEAVLARYVQLV